MAKFENILQFIQRFREFLVHFEQRQRPYVSIRGQFYYNKRETANSLT